MQHNWVLGGDEYELRRRTEIFDGGVDGVAAVEEELNEP